MKIGMYLATTILCIICTSGLGAVARADTVGLWLFNELVDQTPSPNPGVDPDPPGGETLYDESTNALDFVSIQDFGTLLLSADTPTPIPAPSSLESTVGGARLLQTPSSTLLHRGNTGAMTIEYWFKSLRITPSIAYIMSFDGGDGGGSFPPYSGDWGIYTNSDGDMRYFEYSNGFPEVGTSSGTNNVNVHDGDWHHVAFTIDAGGTLSSYVDGLLENQLLNTGSASSAVADVLLFGASAGQAFTDHDFLIDELRISDTALLPGNGTGVDELAWNATLGPVIVPRPDDFGKQWVRDNDFMISSWGISSDMNEFVGLGLNTALNNASGYQQAIDAGIISHLLGGFAQLDDQARAVIDQAAQIPNLSGYLLRDEIGLHEIDALSEVADYIRQTDPTKILYAGLGGSTPSYIDQVIQNIKPDAVVHGFYPYQGPSQATDEFAFHLEDIALVRERALFYDLPYFAYIGSFDDLENGLNDINDNRRLPTESELRADLFSKLSAGIKGFIYFVVDARNGGPTVSNALIDRSGNPSSLYAPAAEANAEVANLGKSLRFLESTDWRFLSGGVDPSQGWIDDFDANAGSGMIEGVQILGSPQAERNALVGYFTDDHGGDYFMLVNNFHGDSLDAAAAAVDFTLTFDPSIDTIWRLNRLTGLVEQIDLVNHTLNLTLPGGTGDLFKFGDGLFAGLPIAGDLDGDGFVGITDLNIVLGNWNQNVTPGDPLAGDPSGDGFVGIGDLNQVLGNWNAGTPPTNANVPEPGSLWLTSLLLLQIRRSGRAI